jgi:hypothetical protein
MKCPHCEIETEFHLLENPDKYHDGIIVCKLCKYVIAIFVFIFTKKENEDG